MRRKREAVLCFEWCGDGDLKIVAAHRRKYKGISRVLDRNPEILDRADRDLKVLSVGGAKGRKADFTSENLLRAMIVHTVEGDDLRGTIIRIAESPFLQDFLRLGRRPVMDFTFLDRALGAIRPETWKRINEVLTARAWSEKRIDPSAIRVDTTVVETTIHYPTDSSLLWDGWRVLARLLGEAQTLDPALGRHRFHDRKVKGLHLRITRYAASPAKERRRYVRKCWRKLIPRVTWIAGIAGRLASESRAHADLAVRGIGAQIERVLPLVRTVLSTSERANLLGETVPARERVFSLFEPHTELIQRGKARKPVEFGHMMRLSQTREKFITDYEVMEHRLPDPELTEICVDRHERLFGAPPAGMTADHGFHPKAETREALEARVKTLAIPRKLSDWGTEIDAAWQRFRAGIEGTISVLKRAYRLRAVPVSRV